VVDEETIFQCLICGEVGPVRTRPPKCGACGSGNGVTRPAARGDVAGARQSEEEEKKMS
jgi:hypothetical protein